MNDKNILIPEGYSLVKAGQKIPKGSLWLRSIYNINENGNRDITKWEIDRVTIGEIRAKHWLLSIRKKRKVGPAIPKGYRIIKVGDMIPEGYYYQGKKSGGKNLTNWTENSDNMCAGQKRTLSDSLWIAPIIRIPKTYKIKLTKEQIEILYYKFNPNAAENSIWDKVSKIREENKVDFSK